MSARIQLTLAAVVGGGFALWFYSGTLIARDVMTPECRKRVDYLDPYSRPLVRPATDYEFDEVVRRNLAAECGPARLWGRL